MAQVPKPPGHILLIRLTPAEEDEALTVCRDLIHLICSIHTSCIRFPVGSAYGKKKTQNVFLPLCLYVYKVCACTNMCVWGWGWVGGGGGGGESAEILIRMHVAQLKS